MTKSQRCALKDITAEQARALLDYNPQTGILTWKARPESMFKGRARSAAWLCLIWNQKHAGKPAGCLSERGYIKVRINDRLYQAHRVAWLIVNGEWPEKELDHEKGTGEGNKISNLRPANRSQNMQNRVLSSRNTSGHAGISWHKAARKWAAYITIDRRREHLGLFDDLDAAIRVRADAKKRLHVFQPVDRRAA